MRVAEDRVSDVCGRGPFPAVDCYRLMLIMILIEVSYSFVMGCEWFQKDYILSKGLVFNFFFFFGNAFLTKEQVEELEI